ncbi:hypothetical protein MGN70_004253 [Eutypa lata]|nr:hypothetical protein MGN70_004253 [Eutypa lata]
MQQNTITTTILGLAATTAILLNGAAADFTIYLGNTNEIDNPGISFSAAGMQVHDHAPLDCSEVSDMVTISTPSDNDASSGGWACDGCNADAVRDWDVQRFEMYNGDDAVGSETDNPIPLFSSATGSVTLYQTDGTNYDMRDSDDNLLGTCTRPEDPQEMDCSEVIAATFLTHAFSCTSDLTPNAEL